MAKKEIQTCFSPALYDLYKDQDAIVVVVDVLRATSAICTALHHGVKKMIPVAGVEQARAYKANGYLTACERDAVKQDGFDFGNSPFSFMDNAVKDQTIVISTTNGTQAIEAARDASIIVIGSFLNISALSNWLAGQQKKVIILCAGWKNRFNLEDSLFAGALSRNLLQSELFYTHCDSTINAGYLNDIAGDNMFTFLENSSHRKRLGDLHLEKDIRFCLTPDYTSVIPVFEGDGLVKLIAEKAGLQTEKAE
jgi:2-phosphosulfolactate phosphatase